MTIPESRSPLPQERAPQSALHRLREELPHLSPAMLRVAEVILADPASVADSSITLLAERAETAPAAISRLAARLGYPGFPQLRSAIAVEQGRRMQSGWEHDIGSAITPTDSPQSVLDTLAGTASQSLREAASSLDLEHVTRAAAALADAERVHLHGEWGDSIAIREMYMRLLRIGVAVWNHDGTLTTLYAVCNTLTERDAVLVLDRSGVEETSLAFVMRARETGATTIALHGEPDSPLARAADIAIYTGIRNGIVWTQSFAGRMSDTLTTSLLWMLVAQQRSADATMRFIDDGVFPPPVTQPPAHRHSPTPREP